MKIVVPIALREYRHADSLTEGDDVFIAQTLVEPVISTSAASASDAIAEMQATIADFYRRLHPRALWGLRDLTRPWVIRRRIPVYQAALYDWYTGDMSQADVWIDIDALITPRHGGFFQVSVPLFGLSTVVHPSLDEQSAFHPPEDDPLDALDEDGLGDDVVGDDDDEMHSEEDPFEPSDYLDEILFSLTRELAKNGNQSANHRPTPDEIAIVDVEVEFEPLDLSLVSAENLWMDIFEDEEIATANPDKILRPTLDAIAQKWTDFEILPAFERELHAHELKTLLLSKDAVPTVVVGPPRVGKTTLIKHIAWLLKALKPLDKREMWFCDGPRLVATDPMEAGWQQQVRNVVDELEASSDVLYIGRLLEVLDAGKYVGSDYNLAQFLKPTLVDKRIRIVAEATIEEWNEIERRDIGFARCFTVVRQEDLPATQSQQIITSAAKRIADHYEVQITNDAIDRARSLQVRFATEGSVVGRTIDFLQRTIKHVANRYEHQVGVNHVVESFCSDTGLPVILVDDRQHLHIEDVRTRLRDRVKGQDEAVNRVADVIGITKAGLASEDRPLSSFLFVGPTGVGKTELARALAEFLFGSQERLVRLDMSEYSHADAYNRLIGEGREDGDLTGPVRRQPFCIVLLDEIEKAHQSVFDVLLQVLGEARLTDVSGRTTRFQNTMIIMTSNLGVESLRPAIGFEQGNVQDSYAQHFRREAQRFFRPEFLARIDQFIAFKSLTQEVVREIAERELIGLKDRDGLRSQDVQLEFDDELPQWLAKRGFHEKYGARPLKRVLEQEVVWKLAAALASSRTEPGMSRTVRITPVGESLKFDTTAVSGDSTVASARQRLLLQIEEIASLRRKVQRHMLSNIYGDQEWEVHHFDLSIQSPNFWTDPMAPGLSQRAEAARKVVEPITLLAQELAALEDLAAEAFHARTFVLSSDLTQRLEELRTRVGELGLSLLRSVDDDPDHIALFLITKHPDDPWRSKLIDWYTKRAAARGWKIRLWQPIVDWAAHARPEDQDFDVERVFWEQTKTPRGLVVGLEIDGFAARPLSISEDGLQRMVSNDGNAVCDVVVLTAYEMWPFPHVMSQMRPQATVTRTYNFRTSEVNIPGHPPIKLAADNPWRFLEDTVESLAWNLVEERWE